LPRQTLDRGCGSCRDFAVLFAEAARSLGFGARLVSGYLYNPDQPLQNDAGSTHAWAEIYRPGPGWITFDPTHRALGGFNLIPVAVGRKHRPGDARGRHVLRHDRRLPGDVGRSRRDGAVETCDSMTGTDCPGTVYGPKGCHEEPAWSFASLGFGPHHEDPQMSYSAEAQEKREFAARARRLAGSLTVEADRERLIRSAEQLESEARELEGQADVCAENADKAPSHRQP
jgi:hypothetical protein